MKLLKAAPILVALFTLMPSPVHASAPPGPYFNGFEQNTKGWFDATNGGFGKIQRVPSGYVSSGYASGISSSSGQWHARLTGQAGCDTQCGPNTNWGGYTSQFPQGGYLTQVDVYLDVTWAGSNRDRRFDYSSAINSSAPTNPPTFLRDWFFNAGTNPVTDTSPAGFYVNASTNGGRTGAFPENPCPAPNTPPNGCRTPVHITTSGWYTFRHTFQLDATGHLNVTFDIFPAGSQATVAHWTIFDMDGPPGTIGGNRYGWFFNEEIPELAIDNSLRTGLCHSGEGDGDAQDNNSQKKGKFHFKNDQCQGGQESGDVEEQDDSGSQFQSTTADSVVFVPAEDSESVTMIGTGTHDGLPVGYTLVVTDYGGVLPSVFSLVLTDGYALAGAVIDGTATVV